MSQTHFTPGPWFQSHRKQDDEDGGYITQVYDSDGKTIANLAWHPVETSYGLRTDREENAHLIAQAPSMYAELAKARATIQALIEEGYIGYVEQRDRIDTLLAKARG